MFKFSAVVEFKTILLIYKVLNDQTPSQHKECIVAYNTDRVICSQSAGLVLAPRISKVEAVADPSAIRLLFCGASYLFVLRSIPSPSLPLSNVFHSLWFVFCHDHLRVRVPVHMCPLLAFSAVDSGQHGHLSDMFLSEPASHFLVVEYLVSGPGWSVCLRSRPKSKNHERELSENLNKK